MSQCYRFLPCGALLASLFFLVAPVLAAPTLAPGLAAELERAAADELVPVTIIMRDQVDPESLLPVVTTLPAAERRAFAKAELQTRAAQTQANVRSYLAAEAEAGRAANVRPLWIANGILADLTPAAAEGLLAFPEIRKVLWDRDIPPEESNDDGEIEPADPVRNPGRAEIWQLETINAPDAWALGFDGAGIIVAVQDNGVDRNHPDLATHIWNNAGEIAGNGVDDDNNGYIDDTWGWDFASNDNQPLPAGDDHGTKCAGIVAGDGTDGTRTGVAPQALIMACRVSTWGQNVAGIQYAIDNGAHVITMSRSEKWRFTPKPDYDWWRSVTDGELLTGILHANSIGNEGDNQGTDPIPFNIAAPGCCPTPWPHPDQVQAGVSGITAGCGAIDINDGIASYSSIGPFNWEDIQVNWPEYPHSMRPEYQDYPYSGGLPGLLKPDVCAPGPGTTSIAIGGGYGSFSGTSAATPHVAGAMAVILSANPFLTPEQMAMILQTTAVDLGQPGKDVVFGAGKVDCLAAVQLALLMNDFGLVQGTVTEQGTGVPLADVDVQAVGDVWNAKTNATGEYTLGLPEGPWTVRFSSFYHEDGEITVQVSPQQTLTEDVVLVAKPLGAVGGRVRDAATLQAIVGADVEILDTPIPLVQSDATGSYQHPDVPDGTYTVAASKFGYAPAALPAQVEEGGSVLANFLLSPALAALDMETDPGWTVGFPGDNATTGVWVRVDPNGTSAQPENDHTADPGVQCWVTGQGSVGGSIGENDVDNGHTSLLTGVLDLTGAPEATVSYWAWYVNNGNSVVDDEWVVEITNNDWVDTAELVRLGSSTNGWEQFNHRVADYVAPNATVQIRFVAEDAGGGSIVEAAVDDFQIFAAPPATDVGPVVGATVTRLALHPNAPNPFAATTTIRYSLPAAAVVDLRVFDVSGRLVRTLASGELREAGPHQVRWDGTDSGGARVASGVYFYRVDALGQTATRRMIRLK